MFRAASDMQKALHHTANTPPKLQDRRFAMFFQFRDANIGLT
mgnify:CR=1 FL=1